MDIDWWVESRAGVTVTVTSRDPGGGVAFCPPDVDPSNGVGVFFSNDLYEELSFIPALERQWEAVRRASGDAHKRGRDTDVHGAKVTGATVQSPRKAEEPAAARKDAAHTARGPARPGTAAHAGPAASPPQGQAVRAVALPQPRVPYPCYSALTETEQKQYLYLLKCSLAGGAAGPDGFRGGWSQRLEFQHLKQRVAEEVPEFLRFVHNAAKQNHGDYDHMSPAAALYTQKHFEASVRRVQLLPPFYSVMETLMLTGAGATSLPPLTLTHHKTLLALGKVPFVKVPSGLRVNMLTLPSSAEALLPLVSEGMSFTELSEDVNVEKLAVKYGVRVCITAQALFTLLNNHGPSFQDAWEVPVCVRQLPARAGQQTDSLVFIESPLPPKEWTVRKRNEIFFQAALEAAMMNPTSNVALQAMTLEQLTSVPECPVGRMEMPLSRAVNAGLDLMSDYTEMETFGNEMPIPCQQPGKDLSPVVGQLGETRSGFHCAGVKGGGSSGATEEHRRPPLGLTATLAATSTSLLAAQSTNCGHAAASKSTLTLFGLDSEEASPRETELDNLSSSGADGTAETEPRPSESGAESSDTELVIDEGDNATAAGRKRRLLAAGCPERLVCGEKGGDKEGPCAPFTSECLASSGRTAPLAPQGSCQEPGSDKAQSSPHTRATKAAQKRRSASVDTGPLGHILKMQTKLMEAHVRRLPPPPPALHGTAVPAAPMAPLAIELGGSEQRPPTSPRAWPGGSSRDICLGRGEAMPAPEVQGAELFSKELLQEEEHASEFVPPATGNVAYKLLSLADLPLLVRTHVHRAQTRPRKASRTATKKQVPVRVFAKTEYQACYGLEANTLAEDCALWLEATLNSNSWFYRGRVDVLTAEPLLLEEFSSSDLRRSLHYNPTEPLKLLHRIMKRLYSLPAGHYLLSHVAGDVSGALSGSVSSARSAYNLHSAHGQLPKAACSPCVPWVPINTCLLLPFHSQYGRVPGTFPPSPQCRGTANKRNNFKAGSAHGGSHGDSSGHQASSQSSTAAGAPGSKKKKKKKNKGMKRKMAWEERKQQLSWHKGGGGETLPGQS
ncbi:unnamed protein product [Lampetra fluviatilis]